MPFDVSVPLPDRVVLRAGDPRLSPNIVPGTFQYYLNDRLYHRDLEPSKQPRAIGKRKEDAMAPWNKASDRREFVAKRPRI